MIDQEVLHILNGQAMYDEFKRKKFMGHYVPFNEAMCVNATTASIFDQAFIATRASGHHVSVEDYRSKVITPLNQLFQKSYNNIILWFGEDMFCQMNLLTILAYLEQSQYRDKVVYNSFKENDERKISQTELTLGSYYSVYEEVLMNHRRPTIELLPVMDQAIALFLEMKTEDNAVRTYILDHIHLPTTELVMQLFNTFPAVGYGDTQYIELIETIKQVKEDEGNEI